MRILITYGTSEQQTRKIVDAVGARVHELSHDAHIFDTASLDDIARYNSKVMSDDPVLSQ